MSRYSIGNRICLTLATVALLLPFFPPRALADAEAAPNQGPAETPPAASKKLIASAALPISPSGQSSGLSKRAEEAAQLLGIEPQVRRYLELKNAGKLQSFDREALRLQLTIIRKVDTAGLQLRKVSAQFDREIIFEQQAVDKLTRNRDFMVAQTNNANFLQLGILSTIIDGDLGETHNKTRLLNSNRLNIVSGFMVGGLAAIAMVEEHGGVRKGKADPNLLGQTLGLDAPAEERLPPMLWTYLNSVSPVYENGVTRRQQLLQYWETNKNIPINVKQKSTIEKVSVLGPHHSKWCENIKMINARIIMLYDLRAMCDLLETNLVELLQNMN